VLISVPATRTPGRRPLLLDLHASGFNPAAQAEISGLREVAGAAGFAVAAPAGVLEVPPLASPDPRGNLAWNVPGVPTTAGAFPPADARDDVAFLDRVLDEVGERLGTDPERVFLTGWSGGARMACAFACRRAERVAGIAPVAGLRAGRADPADLLRPDPADCRPSVTVPVVAFHGRRDEVNPYEGSTDRRWGYPVPLVAETWARRNGCSGGPEVTRVGPTVTRSRWPRPAEVALYTVDDGGHTWPGSAVPLTGYGLVSRDLDASAVLVDFFDRLGRGWR
jgi:polyhydroxybutyrate depolymerase